MSPGASESPSRLALISSGADRSGTIIPTLGEVSSGKRLGEKVAELTWLRVAAGVEQQPLTTRLEQQLPAASAGDERSAVSGDHADRHEPAGPGRVQRAAQTELRAQGQTAR